MAKRIVSGIFILTALGALGVILAGAMTSGEQLIVRFLTAVTVAALALYVISDLRLQNEQEEPPVERSSSGADRPAHASAVMASVTGSHRRDRLKRRGGEASVEPTPNFEEIEPVTARPRAVALADPTEAVTGSRILPPAPEEMDRIVPPHPMTGYKPVERGRQPAPWMTPPVSPVTHPADDSLRNLADATADKRPDDQDNGGPDEPDVVATADRVDAAPAFLTPPDERPSMPSTGSVIATTSFTYSGRLDSVRAEWPPRPLDHTEPVGNGEGELDDPTVAVGPIDAPTAELPALTDLSTVADDEPLLAMFAKEFSGGGNEVSPHIFAVDTAEIPLADTAHQSFPPESHGEAAEAAASFGGAGWDGPTSTPDTVEEADIGVPSTAPATDTGDSPVPAGETLSAARRIEAAEYAEPLRTDYLEFRDTRDIVITADFERPLPAAKSPGLNLPDKLTAAIRSGETQVINSLISQGMLSTSGPITDRDVRTMVYVAFTSNELRKLILAGGTPDGIRAGDLDLGEVELFDESRFAPPPKLLYSGPPDRPETRPEPILDLVALENEAAADEQLDLAAERELDDAELVPTLPTPSHIYRRADVDRVEQ